MASLSACGNQPEKTAPTTPATSDSAVVYTDPQPAAFSDTLSGKATHLYKLQSANLKAFITDYGGRLVALYTQDKNGQWVDVVAGFDGVKGYEKTRSAYYGAIIGRYGNRIGKGKFTLDGQHYQIPVNNGVNALHGGPHGFSDYVWDAHQTSDSSLELTMISPDGDMGFPGKLMVTVDYKLELSSLRIDYSATTDKKTVVNLTNHAYWNLNGAGSGTILDHQLQIFARAYTPIDSGLIPTGKIDSVVGTPFDFTQPTVIGSRINDTNQQIVNGMGYDHNFVLSGHDFSHSNVKIEVPMEAAKVWADKSGIVMDVFTMEPGLQFYTGNFMNGQYDMKYGKKDNLRTALCLETQHFPDSPNEPSWPSTVLKPGEKYNTETVYSFSVKK
jgi:aldose 1-epimerase